MIGTTIEIKSEKSSNNFWSMSGMMAPFYEMLKVLSEWLVKKGLSRIQAQQYITSLYSALAELAAATAAARAAAAPPRPRGMRRSPPAPRASRRRAPARRRRRGRAG